MLRGAETGSIQETDDVDPAEPTAQVQTSEIRPRGISPADFAFHRPGIFAESANNF